MNRREALALLSSLPAVRSVSRLDVSPKTVICIETSMRLTPAGREALRDQVRQVFPEQQVLVLDAGMTIRTLTEPGS